MGNDNDKDLCHPVRALCTNAQTLCAHAQQTHHQTAQSARQARATSQKLAQLDMDAAFRQLRQMVSLLTSCPEQAARAENVTLFRPRITAVAQAAE